MKVLITVTQQRIEKYSALDRLPQDWQLIYMPPDADETDMLSQAGDADFIFADAIAQVSGSLIRQMPNLKLIHSEGVGFNGIDIKAAKAANVFVCNNAGANAGAVAEQAVLLMLALMRRLHEGDDMVRTGRQIQAKENFIMNGITELGICRVGLIGFGAIAKATAKLLSAFGCEVLYFSRSRSPQEEEYKVRYCSLDKLIPACDVISLHLPVTPETAGLVDDSFLSRMKSTALLINTARGKIVDQEALLRSLVDGKIAGAGLDTLDPEPVTLDNPLLGLPEDLKYKLVFSPHIGGTTDGMFKRAHKMVWSNIMTAAKGKRPVNIVNGL